jgi:hypothetical protein
MSLKRLPSVLHRHSLLKGGALRRKTRRLPGRLHGASALPGRLSSFEEPLNEARELALEIGWSLRRSEERLDSSLQRIDSTLGDLAAQREQIRRLEHDLGIER